PVRLCLDATERDALAGQRLLDPVSLRLRPRACSVGLGVQLTAHLARQTGDRTEPEHLGRIALIRSGGLLAIAAHEGVLRLRAGPVGSALRVTAEASERIRPSGRAEVDAAQPGHVGVRPALLRPSVAPAVLRPERVAEQLVADDEEALDAEHATIEGRLHKGGVLPTTPRDATIHTTSTISQ